MKSRSLLLKLSKKYPKWIMEKYHDYAGLQIGKLKDDINDIFLCLDFDAEVLDFLKKENLLNKIDLIITHHPFIYGRFKDVIANDPIKKELCDEMNNLNIPIYSYHTNFDEGKDGMNDALANKLGLIDIHPIPSNPIGRAGKLKQKMNAKDFAKFAMKQFEVDYSLLIGEENKEIETVSIIGGGGWHGYYGAMLDGYDIFISGDIPHHGRRGVIANHYLYLDMPHEIENIFVDQMEKVLKSFDSNLNIYKVKHEKLPKVILKNN